MLPIYNNVEASLIDQEYLVEKNLISAEMINKDDGSYIVSNLYSSIEESGFNLSLIICTNARYSTKVNDST